MPRIAKAGFVTAAISKEAKAALKACFIVIGEGCV
jgi:hypothetical protein